MTARTNTSHPPWERQISYCVVFIVISSSISDFQIYTLVYNCLQLKRSLQYITCRPVVEFLVPCGIFHWSHKNLFHSLELYSFKMVLILAFPPCVPWSVFCRFSGHFFAFPIFPIPDTFYLTRLDFSTKLHFLILHVITFWVLCFSYLLLWVPWEIRKMKRGFYCGGCPSANRLST